MGPINIRPEERPEIRTGNHQRAQEVPLVIAVATQGFLADTRLPAPIGHARWRADLAQPEGAESETTSYRRCPLLRYVRSSCI